MRLVTLQKDKSEWINPEEVVCVFQAFSLTYVRLKSGKKMNSDFSPEETAAIICYGDEFHHIEKEREV
jgi:hypothetical protein